MKSPADLSRRLAKQWQQSSLRLERLLSTDCWPLQFSIGKPSSAEFSNQATTVQQHLAQWRSVIVGEVVWENINYRTGAEAVSMPLYWYIRSPTEWSAAAGLAVQQEYAALEYVISNVDNCYHQLLIRERALWRGKNLDELVTTAELANTLAPGSANGRPLRLLAGLGVDTKFFERNGRLLTRFLDERHQGAASEQGLHAFLDAHNESDHWLLVIPLAAGLLPFKRQRVSSKELAETHLPAAKILVIENESCAHLLPELPNTIAILGAGLDLQWLKSPAFSSKAVGYWGDMDTWGLLMLARARQYCPAVVTLLMERLTFDKHAVGSAVVEPVVAQHEPPVGLSVDEERFFRYLLSQDRGRLEQEFLPKNDVEMILLQWSKLAHDRDLM